MTENTLVPVSVPQRGNRFDDELWELAYEIWLLKADRNAVRTHRMLRQHVIDSMDPEFDDIDEESLNIPGLRAVQKRIKDHKWRERASNDMAGLAPHLGKEHFWRLYALTDAAESFYAAMMHGEYDHFASPGILASKVAVAKDLLMLRGLGTASGLAPISMPQAEAKVLDQELSVQEMQRQTRERLRELRDGR